MLVAQFVDAEAKQRDIFAEIIRERENEKLVLIHRTFVETCARTICACIADILRRDPSSTHVKIINPHGPMDLKGYSWMKIVRGCSLTKQAGILFDPITLLKEILKPKGVKNIVDISCEFGFVLQVDF